jgi:hypothetical protein
MRHGSQFTSMLFHPRIDGGIALDSAVESQKFRFHRRSTFCFRNPSLRRTIAFSPAKIARLELPVLSKGESLPANAVVFYNPERL